jgi:hypothetical protein
LTAVASHAAQSPFPSVGGTGLYDMTFKPSITLRVENKNKFVLGVVVAVVNRNCFHGTLLKVIAN